MIDKDYLIDQAKNIILSKKPNLNVQKFMELEFSLLVWQTIYIELKKHEFEDGLSQYLCSYFILIEGEAKFQKINIQSKQLELDIDLVKDQPFNYGLEYSQQQSAFCQLLALSKCTVIVIKESRIQQILKNYYNLCESQVLESLCKLYFLHEETSVFVSSLLHTSIKYKFQKGQSIYRFGDQILGFYMILEGEIKIMTQVEMEQLTKLAKRTVSKNIVQKILSLNSSFGEQDLFFQKARRSEQAECNSLECQVVFIPKESFQEAYQHKMQDPTFQLSQLMENFEKYLKLQVQEAQKVKERHLQLHKPIEEPKQQMNANDPLLMNLNPLNQMKYSYFEPPKDILRTSSFYSQTKMKETALKRSITRMPSQEVLVNQSLAKINKVNDFLTVKDYISEVKNHGQLFNMVKRKSNNGHKKNNSVATELQLKMIDYTRQLTPLHIKVRKSSQPVSRQSFKVGINSGSPKKRSFLMLYPEYQKFSN